MGDTGFCSGCGTARPTDAKFCPSCGQAFEARGSVGGTAVANTTAPTGTGLVDVAGAAQTKRPRSRRRTFLNVAAVGLVVFAVATVVSKPGAGAAPTTSARAAVTYQLTGSATSASLTYTDGAGNIQQQTSVAVPLVRKSGASGISFNVSHGDFVSFSAQNNGDSGDLSCTIEADGVVINRGHSSGGYAIVSCSAQVP